MSTTRYDRYGRQAGYINPIDNKVEAYLIAQASSTTQYICYYETGNQPRAIRRNMVDETGTLQQVAVGWGTWENRESINYYPVNIVFIVDDETKALVSVQPSVSPVSPI